MMESKNTAISTKVSEEISEHDISKAKKNYPWKWDKEKTLYVWFSRLHTKDNVDIKVLIQGDLFDVFDDLDPKTELVKKIIEIYINSPNVNSLDIKVKDLKEMIIHTVDQLKISWIDLSNIDDRDQYI